MSTQVLEHPETQTTQTTSSYNYGGLRHCTIAEFVEHQLKCDEEDRWYIRDSFDNITFEGIKDIKSYFKRNLKRHAEIIKLNKNLNKKNDTPYKYHSTTRYNYNISNSSPFDNAVDQFTLITLRDSYRLNHIIYSILKGNTLKQIDANFDESQYSRLLKHLKEVVFMFPVE